MAKLMQCSAPSLKAISSDSAVLFATADWRLLLHVMMLPIVLHEATLPPWMRTSPDRLLLPHGEKLASVKMGSAEWIMEEPLSTKRRASEKVEQ
eukprot:2038940-Amphidinium_carterae.1